MIELWKSNNLLPEESDPSRRSKQVVWAIFNDADQVIGLSTAFPEFSKVLQNHVFMFRCFILPDYRFPGLLTKLTVMTRDYLNSIYKTEDPQCIGMMSIIENERINEYNKPIYKGGDMIFIGYTAKGMQMRIVYFDGATI